MSANKLLDVINSNVGEFSEIYFIAEIGINHNGDVSLAKRMMEEAAKAGCDAVKFQKRKVDEVYSDDLLSEKRESPWGTTQREQKYGLELDEDDYLVLKNYASDLGLDFSASAWDFTSLQFVESLEPSFHKVASAFITHESFLRKVASFGRPTVFSTGMCNEQAISIAISIFKDAKCSFIPLHTVSVYPCPEEELNLLYIKTLRDKFGVNVGYSGHESSVSPSLAAASLGAKVIERHITLDRALYGSDQSASLEVDGLRRLVAGLRKYPSIMGDGVKRFEAKEKSVAKKLRYWEN